MKAVIVLVPLALFAQSHPQFVWQGEVDGAVVLHLKGERSGVQVQAGGPVRNSQFRFNDPLPQSQQDARLEVLEGRGYVHIIDQPRLENGYTLSVAIEDRQPGSAGYSIALFWDPSDRALESGSKNKRDRVTWTGRVDEEALVSCQAKSCVSSAERGAPVASERYKFSRPMPARELDVHLEDADGRGEIRLVEQPRERNHYAAKVSIRDPQGGSGEYSFTLVWDRELSGQTPAAEPAGRGLIWSGAVTGRVQVTVEGGAVFTSAVSGQPVRGEHSDLLRPFPARSDLAPVIQKLRGRGRVAILERPSEQNHYRLVFEVDDPGPGADTYEVEVDW